VTQEILAARVGCSRSAISRIERGQAGHATVHLLERIATQLGARLVVTVQWQGEGLDRLLDSQHARLVDWTISWLGRLGWEAFPEVTFQIRGERGSIDVLARHPGGALLVVEVKSTMPDAQSMLSSIDRKARLAPQIARERGWAGPSASRLLVLPADRTNRRRAEALGSTLQAVFPKRTVAVKRWAASPEGTLAGMLFVSNVTDTGARHRVPRPR
jgi:transcriptional regulator with XRE-family HTH domain